MRKVDAVRGFDPGKISEWVGQMLGARRDSVVIHSGRASRRTRLRVSQRWTGDAFSVGDTSRAQTSS